MATSKQLLKQMSEGFDRDPKSIERLQAHLKACKISFKENYNAGSKSRKRYLYALRTAKQQGFNLYFEVSRDGNKLFSINLPLNFLRLFVEFSQALDILFGNSKSITLVFNRMTIKLMMIHD